MGKWLGAPVGPAALFLPAPAFAHPGHGEAAGSFLAGLLHPLTGVDHLLAMLMVGLWAGIALRRHVWAPPAAFVAFMLAGFGYGAMGGALPVAELLIVASLIVLGLALVFEVKPPLAVSIAVVALFAVAHGHAHGAELPHGASAWRFAAGFTVMTALLHCLGLALVRAARGPFARPVARITGVAAALVGATMLFAT